MQGESLFGGNKIKRRNIFIGVFAFFHFMLTVILFARSFSLSMARFDNLRPPTLREKILDQVSEILLFPFLPLSRLIPFSLGGADFIFIFGNSLLWGICAYYLMAFFHRRYIASKSRNQVTD